MKVRINSQCNEMGQELPPEVTVEAEGVDNDYSAKAVGDLFRAAMDAATKPKEPKA